MYTFNCLLHFTFYCMKNANKHNHMNHKAIWGRSNNAKITEYIAGGRNRMATAAFMKDSLLNIFKWRCFSPQAISVESSTAKRLLRTNTHTQNFASHCNFLFISFATYFHIIAMFTLSAWATEKKNPEGTKLLFIYSLRIAADVSQQRLSGFFL